jgi:hypothetical protein
MWMGWEYSPTAENHRFTSHNWVIMVGLFTTSQGIFPTALQQWVHKAG